MTWPHVTKNILAAVSVLTENGPELELGTASGKGFAREVASAVQFGGDKQVVWTRVEVEGLCESGGGRASVRGWGFVRSGGSWASSEVEAGEQGPSRKEFQTVGHGSHPPVLCPVGCCFI